MKVGIIGYGNLGWHLARWLSPYLTSIEILTTHSDPSENTLLSPPVYFHSSLKDLSPDLDLILIAVKDHQIENVAQQLRQTYSSVYQPLIAHTSGTVSWKCLTNYFELAGVLYPFQTFTRGIPLKSYKDIPIIVDGPNSYVKECLVLFCERIGNQWYLLNEEQRKFLHLAGVFINNFVNVLGTAAEEILAQIPLHRSILQPILSETLRKYIEFGGKQSQTGPALRNDQNTLNTHLRLLASHLPHLQATYQNLSQLIQHYQNQNPN